MLKFKWDSYELSKNEIEIQKVILDKDFSIHSHDFSELVIILSGVGRHIIQDKSYATKKGDVYVITGDIAHGFKDGENLELINILFHPAFPLLPEIRNEMQGYRAMFEIEPLYRIENDFKAKLTLDIFQINEITKLTDEIFARSTVRTTENRVIIQSLLNLLIARLSSFYSGKKEHKSKQMLQLSGILGYIEGNLSGDLDTETLAKTVNFSPRHFNRLFHSVFSMTPKQYIMDQRLLHACKLLCETCYPVTELSAQCGYSDSSYFSRIFYKKLGLTPSEYRKKNKKV